MKPRAATGLAVLFAAAMTAVVSFAPAIKFAYRAPELHVALETGEGLIGILTAYLVFGRFKETRLSRDLALSYSMLISGLVNLAFSAIPAALIPAEPFVFTTWATLLVRIVSAGMLAFAALSTSQRVDRELTGPYVTGGAVMTLVIVGVIVAAAAPSLPLGIDPLLSPEATERPLLVGHPIVLGAQILLVVFFRSLLLDSLAKLRTAPTTLFVPSESVQPLRPSLGSTTFSSHRFIPSTSTPETYCGCSSTSLYWLGHRARYAITGVAWKTKLSNATD